MAGHFESNLNLDKIPLKSSSSLNKDRLDARYEMDASRFLTSNKNFLNSCDRPNTALDFTSHHKPAPDFTPEKQHYRPQTSAGVRPGSGRAARPHHVSIMAPSNGEQPTRSRRRYKRPKARRRIIPRVVKSRELRAGSMHVGCDCVKLNGLQDACRRRECITWHGHPNPECEQSACGPSIYGNARHLQAIVDAAYDLRQRRRHPLPANYDADQSQEAKQKPLRV